ncbi:hypothetical protein V9T40_002049 [Parthenolecanium corni]|uniref:Microsomal glutathione S-transferase 1 n=1 Tax=Parthenolecanium corni TaxID=536013 RepID=A0AAN9TWJ5_9HEMI
MVEIKLEDPIVKSFLFYVSLLVAKVLVMALLTALQRMQKKVLPSEEDTKFFTILLRKEMKVARDDPDVERVRRAHLNDLENIPQFIFAGSIYILTQPNEFLAINLFRTYTIFRGLHTLVYAIIPIPQPARVICFSIPFAITYYMLLMNVLNFFKI